SPATDRTHWAWVLVMLLDLHCIRGPTAIAISVLLYRFNDLEQYFANAVKTVIHRIDDLLVCQTRGGYSCSPIGYDCYGCVTHARLSCQNDLRNVGHANDVPTHVLKHPYLGRSLEPGSFCAHIAALLVHRHA